MKHDIVHDSLSKPNLLPETERRRILAIMGFDTWIQRNSAGLMVDATEEVIVADLPPVTQRLPLAVPSSSPTALIFNEHSPLYLANNMLQNRGSVLLILEDRIQADAPLIRALTVLLPGCTICTPETVTRGMAKFALQIGVDVILPNDVLGVRAPTLAELRSSASARRALWRSIKPVLLQLKR